MTIKKKDGSVYIIEGPNKLVKNQEKIDLDKCNFYNFSWDEIVYKGRISSKIPVGTVIEKPTPVDTKEFEPKEKPKEPETKLEPKPETKPEKDAKDDFVFPILKVKVLMHCLPAKVSTHKDLLYGESWERIIYNKKFIFPAVMISNNDLEMSFWTSDPNEKITEKSIVFPFSYEIYNQNTQGYDRVPFDEHRWWKVSQKETKEGGWLISTIPSQEHPDFSDD
jgi:hypothetical protein